MKNPLPKREMELLRRTVAEQEIWERMLMSHTEDDVRQWADAKRQLAERDIK